MNPIIKSHNVRLGQRARAALGRAASDPAEKSIRLLEDRGAVRAIEVRCSCGEATVIELEYPPDETPEAPPTS